MSFAALLDQQAAKDVPWAAQLRLFGFALPEKCADARANSLYIRIALDPRVCERTSRLNPLADNRFGPYYKSVPLRQADPSATDLKNIDIPSPASTFGVVMAMTEIERRELRDRVLDEKLQEGLRKASAQSGEHDNYAFYKMSGEQKLAAARELA
jgi:hypothetical protein